MHNRYNSPAVVRGRRAGDDIGRPIASALPLPRAHVQTIDQSHARCAALGLSRIEAPDLSQLARSDLTVARDRNLRLTTHAAPVMEMLFEQIVNTESMVVLCDATGTVLHSIGDDDFLERANKVALAPGANWSEANKGTNAVGTALIDEVPTLVHADEHFMHANHFLTCSAAPILDPRGNILGVLDVSGDQRSYHQHTMALVKMSARMIENHWLSESYRNLMRLHLHTRPEFIGTLMEGILAISPDGKIVGANRGALDLLGLSGASLRMHTLPSLFGTTVDTLVDQFRSPLALPMALRTHNGRPLHVHARFNWPVWHSIAEAAGALPNPTLAVAAAEPAARTVPAAPAARGGGLAKLATGDEQVAQLITKLERVLERDDIPILIIGETGSGKEELARAIHQDSARSERPFIAVNCGALPEGAPETPLFGRERSLGRAEQAQGGTLFLDEVGELSLPLQSRLLRMLQEGRPELAIICSTRGDLRERIAAQTFREDLYYRLNGMSLRLPALRERTDLAAITQRMLTQLSPGRTIQLTPEVLQLFTHCAWPGNLRQLYNVLRSACLMAGAEPQLRREHLPDDFIEEAQAGAGAKAAAAASADAPSAPRSLEDLEIDAIRQAVDASGGNISAASKRLGISRNTIYRKLRWNQPR
jgi:transcriptional regulator of acetoin/glycerol metabolism